MSNINESQHNNEDSSVTRRDFIRLSVTAAAVTGAGVYGAGKMQPGQAATVAKWTPDEWTPNPLETRVLGSNTVLPRSRASLRIVTLDHRDGAPVRNAGVRVALKIPDGKGGSAEQTLFKGVTNKRGTVDANFVVPPLAKGSYELVVNTNTPALGTDSFSSSLQVAEAAQVLLTTDKPLYQPNQTIHIRALALARPDLLPVADKPLIFEVEDAKGNKVFKKEIRSSKLGVASAEFVLGDEINMGRYTVRAVLGDIVNEKKVGVEKYVLPKFKVKITTEKKYYRPGETVKGTVQADYFFGKTVSGGAVTVKAATFDVGFNDFAEIKGKTGAGGAYEFEIKLPQSFVGLPLEQGNAFVKLEVSVKDTAEHLETVTQTVPVARDAIKIVVVPESGALVPGVENTIFVLTTYPDGAPATARFTFKSAGIDLSGTTDKSGIGEVKLTPQEGLKTVAAAPANNGFAARRMMVEGDMIVPQNANGATGQPLSVQLTAADAQGNKGQTTAEIARRVTDESLLLRASRPIANVGETLHLDVISTRSGGTAYLDLIKDKQTVLTQSIELKKGRATLRVELDETLSGTLQANAYIITPRGDIIRDTKLIYVNPANDLKIAVSADQETYRPGKPAEINLEVTNRDGHAVLAALGVNIVDESVFALQEMQPGMEKVYFTLEKELLEPKIEVHGFDLDGVVPIDDTPRLNADKQRVARVLFAAAQPLSEFGINWNSYDQKWQNVAQKWQERVGKDAQIFGVALQKYQQKKGKFPAQDAAIQALLDEQLIKTDATRDPLGTPYKLLPRYKDFNNGFVLISGGPDKKIGTSDDIFMAGWLGGGATRTAGRFTRRKRGGAEFDEFDEDNEMRGAMGAPGAGGAVFALGAADALGMAPPMAMPAPAMRAANGALARNELKLAASESSASPAAPAAEPVRVRQFFPETLFVNANLLTDERGRASIELDMADSITTWRLTTMGSSAKGALGSTTAPLRVFQDFFVDLDLPVSLTQNDEIEIPVAVYNYLPEKQTVRLKLETDEQWFEVVSDDAEKTVEMQPNQVGVARFRIAAKKIGNHKLTVTARGTKLSDAIQRVIEVRPDGKEIWQTVNDRLEGDIAKTITIPPNAVPGGSNILVRIYPGAFSQMVDGLDKMLQMPYGCFEQNASVAYPNILVMDYLKKTKQIKPELQMKAESYINAGYQRALTYEVKGGGFSWFGEAPAHQVLTAYGIIMFNDMSRVHSVDPNIIARTQQWLASKQKADGSWMHDEGGIAEGIINRQSDALRVTAYVLWALAETGFAGAQVQRGAAYVGAKMGGENDSYALAVIANALVAADKNSEMAARALEKLVAQKTEDARTAHWNSKAPTSTGAKGNSADLETTALAVYALMRSGRYSSLVNKVLTYLVQHKDPQGTWGSTQATVWSLRALLAAMDKAAGEANGEVIVKINGEQAGAFVITPKDSDVMRQIELRDKMQPGANEIEIKWAGKGSALYAISGKHFVPWHDEKEPADAKPLDVDVAYDRTELLTGDIVTCRVKVTNRQPMAATNVIVDLGLPPGFEVQSDDLAELVGSKKISKFSLTGRQAILYIDRVETAKPLSFSYRLKAKFPLKAKSPKSAVYEYYTPDNRGESKPVALVVKKA